MMQPTLHLNPLTSSASVILDILGGQREWREEASHVKAMEPLRFCQPRSESLDHPSSLVFSCHFFLRGWSPQPISYCILNPLCCVSCKLPNFNQSNLFPPPFSVFTQDKGENLKLAQIDVHTHTHTQRNMCTHVCFPQQNWGFVPFSNLFSPFVAGHIPTLSPVPGIQPRALCPDLSCVISNVRHLHACK